MSNPVVDRSTASVVGVLLMVAVTIVVGGVLSVFVLDLGESTSDPAPEVGVTASFDDRKPLDPHWVFTITHVSGDNIGPNEVRIRLKDEFGNEANRTYPRAFSAGQQIRMGLWGDPSRASLSGVNCTVDPVAPPDSSEGQLANGASPPVEVVDVFVIHEPTKSVLDRVTVDLDRYENPRDTELIDGSDPSFGCNDVEWQSGDVIRAD